MFRITAFASYFKEIMFLNQFLNEFKTTFSYYKHYTILKMVAGDLNATNV